MQLRSGLPVLWRSATEVQLGTDPRWAVALTDLSPSAARALQTLTPGADVRAVRAALAREEVATGEVETLLRHLRATHLLVDAHDPGDGSPDATAWGLLSASGNGREVLTRRRRRRVRVCGLGRLGVALAGTLAAAGVGTIELVDPGRVTRHDTGVGGLTARDVGAPRTAAVARLLHDVEPTVRTPAAGTVHTDLVILVEHGAADPVRQRPLLADDVPHLSVVIREASVLVGPLVEPGRTPCLRCVDLHRAERDPAWPTLGAQLVVSDHTGQEESTLAASGAALTAAQALAHLDGRPTALAGGVLEIRLPEVLPHLVSWPAHPDCGCLGPAAAEAAAVPVAEASGQAPAQ